MAHHAKKILMILTSHDRMGQTDKPTGFWFEELAAPYYAFVDAGHEVHIASLRGGAAPVAPGSEGEPGKRPASVERFLQDARAMQHLADTLPLATLNATAYDGVFLPGGHGTMWDLPGSDDLARLIGRMFDANKAVGAVCHGPAGLLRATRKDGTPVVAGKRVNSFTDAEENAVGLAGVVPFLLEARIRELGGVFEHAPAWQSYAVRDGNLVTGQNPQSSLAAAEKFLQVLAEA